MRILLVEDEPHAARMLAKGLREQTYAVDVALDGRKVLELVSISDYDAVILDVMLPFVDMSTTRDQDYLGDGVADELINTLGRIPGIRVAARSSAFAFKGRNVAAKIFLRKRILPERGREFSALATDVFGRPARLSRGF